MTVICFDFFLWQEDKTIYIVHIIENNIQCIKTTSLAWIADVSISLMALSLQLCLRLYLKFFKNVHQSNEILSNKLIFFLFTGYLSDILTPLPEDSHSFIIPMSIINLSAPTIILLDHSGFYDFCLDRHPKVKRALKFIKDNIDQCYGILVDLYVKSNKIKPYDVIV